MTLTAILRDNTNDWLVCSSLGKIALTDATRKFLQAMFEECLI